MRLEPIFVQYIYTESIFRNIVELEGVNIGGHNINNLRYADDTILLAENQEKLQKIVQQVNTYEFGMRIDSKKTKIMNITRNNPTKFEIKIDGKDIEQVSSFVYLG